MTVSELVRQSLEEEEFLKNGKSPMQMGLLAFRGLDEVFSEFDSCVLHEPHM